VICASGQLALAGSRAAGGYFIAGKRFEKVRRGPDAWHANCILPYLVERFVEAWHGAL
jgi:hypothetical protein